MRSARSRILLLQKRRWWPLLDALMAIIAATVPARARAQEPTLRFERLTIEQGLSQNNVYSFTGRWWPNRGELGSLGSGRRIRKAWPPSGESTGSSAHIVRVAIARHRPALILLDAGRPGVRDVELLEHVRAADPAIIPIVVMTTAPRDAARLLGMGAAACLAKPFDLGELLACVARHVQPDRLPNQFACMDARSARPEP